MRLPRRTILVALVMCGSLGLPVCVAAHHQAGDVTIQFSSAGIGPLDPRFFKESGIVFPTQFCGTLGCRSPEVRMVQDPDALYGNPLKGPISARFRSPTSRLSVRFAPAEQGTAVYTLKAFDSRGRVVGERTVTVTEDTGDPQSIGFAYVVIDLDQLRSPARSFTFDDTFVRSSFSTNTFIDYGISDITF